ncbi:MAG: hypothetical protein O3B13_21080, partial [Planctomycetota bacterium]|nr:hypothetical protein [Planctomycetota bacterium]
MLVPSWLRALSNRLKYNQFLRRHGKPVPRRGTRRISLLNRINVGQMAPASEELPDRTMLAATILIQQAAGSLDGELSATDGTIDFGDGVSGTLSVGALQAVQASTSISINATESITFATDVNTLALATQSGQTVSFSTNTASGQSIAFDDLNDSVTSEGATISFTAGTSATLGNINSKGASITLRAGLQGAGNLSVGNVLNAVNLTVAASTNTGDTVTVRGTGSASGQINITAGSTITIDNLVAQTVTITSLNNNIISADGTDAMTTIDPIDVNQLTLTAAAGINVVTLAASLTADNTTSGNITITQDALNARALTISNTAGVGVRNQAAGGTVTVTNADSAIETVGPVVSTNGAIAIDAPTSTVTVRNSVNSDRAATGANGGTVTITAANGITIDSGGSVTTAGGTFTANADAEAVPDNIGTFTLVSGTTIDTTGTTNASATITAADIEIGGTIDSGTARTNLINSAAGRLIRLGTATGVGIKLTDTELDRVTASIIQVGSTTAGNVTVEGDIDPANTSTLTIITGGTITQTSGNTITETNLRLSAAGGVTLNQDNDVDVLAGLTTGAAFSFTDADDLIVGTVDTQVGISTSNGEITLTQDTLDIQQAVNAATGDVNIRQRTAGRQIDLGTETANQLSLTDTELNLITGSVLRIGTSTAGAIHVTAAISPANIDDLTLLSDEGVDDNGNAGSISLPNGGLNVDVDTAVDLTGANDVAEIAGRIADAGQNFVYNDTSDLAIGSVDGTNGITVNAAAVIITAGGQITDGNTTGADITGTSADLTANGGIGDGDAIDTNVDNLTFSNTGSGNVAITDTDGVTVEASSNTAAGGTIDLIAGGDDNVLNINGALSSNNGNITLQGDKLTIGAAVGAGTAIVTLRSNNDGDAIDLGTDNGSANTLDITDPEIDQITAAVIRVGHTGAGNLTITNQIDPANSDTLSLITGGAVIDGTAGEQADITVNNLRISAETGIGAANDIDINVTTLAFTNDTSGQVNITDTAGGVTVDDVDTITTSSAVAGGSLTAASPLTISHDVNVGADMTFTASESGGADDLTIRGNSTVTLTSNTNSTLTFNAGEDIVFGSGAETGTIETAGTGTHTVQLNADTGGNDDGTVTQASSFTAVTTNNLEVTANNGIGTGAQFLQVAVDSLTTDSSGNNADQFIAETNTLTALDLDAGTGDITLVAGNSISDVDANAD